MCVDQGWRKEPLTSTYHCFFFMMLFSNILVKIFQCASTVSLDLDSAYLINQTSITSIQFSKHHVSQSPTSNPSNSRYQKKIEINLNFFWYPQKQQNPVFPDMVQLEIQHPSLCKVLMSRYCNLKMRILFLNEKFVYPPLRTKCSLGVNLKVSVGCEEERAFKRWVFYYFYYY